MNSHCEALYIDDSMVAIIVVRHHPGHASIWIVNLGNILGEFKILAHADPDLPSPYCTNTLASLKDDPSLPGHSSLL